VKLRVFRPFPAEELAQALGGLQALAIMDRSDGFSGQGGPLGAEVRAALFGYSKMRVTNIVYGLGGRDIRVEDFEGVYQQLLAGGELPRTQYLGQRE
jgi:pyruvate ferredoxin oxidoreductase alpha subunit